MAKKGSYFCVEVASLLRIIASKSIQHTFANIVYIQGLQCRERTFHGQQFQNWLVSSFHTHNEVSFARFFLVYFDTGIRAIVSEVFLYFTRTSFEYCRIIYWIEIRRKPYRRNEYGRLNTLMQPGSNLPDHCLHASIDTNCPVCLPWFDASTTAFSAPFFAGLALVPVAFFAFALVADVFAMVVAETVMMCTIK